MTPPPGPTEPTSQLFIGSHGSEIFAVDRGDQVAHSDSAGSGNAGPGVVPFIARTWKIVSVPRTSPVLTCPVTRRSDDPACDVKVFENVVNVEKVVPPLVLYAYW